MGLLSFLNKSRPPAAFTFPTLVVASAAHLAAAENLLAQLQKQFGGLGLAVTAGDYRGSLPWSSLPNEPEQAKKWLADAAPQRVIFIGMNAAHAEPSLAKVSYWINASDPKISRASVAQIFVNDPALLSTIPGAAFTGDPLLNITSLPEIAAPDCARFQEQRNGARWVGYFAGTQEGEEEAAYLLFNRLIRERMGLMMLAPQDVARAEPVYRDAIKYRLQTIRHNRLSTSFIPLKTRVYYIEEEQARRDLYGCADFVVAGATLEPGINQPDIVTPLLYARPLIVGPAGRQSPLVRAALAANALWSAENPEQIFQHVRNILQNPVAAKVRAEAGRAWLLGQLRATERISELIQ